MKKGDLIWGGLLLLIISILVVPSTRAAFMQATETHPYIAAFFKFAILATMGDLLGARIVSGNWIKPEGSIYKAAVWGVIGLALSLSLIVFSTGVASAQSKGMLPFMNSVFARALLTSMAMNITLSPVVFLFHKFTDTYIDEKCKSSEKNIDLKYLVSKIDWYTYINFSLLKTIPFFWIPCHTMVFLLPAQYRVIASAFLSIALGLILALANKSKDNNENDQNLSAN